MKPNGSTAGNLTDDTGWFTPEEAENHGIDLGDNVPVPSVCQFCARVLYHRGIKHPFKNQIMHWNQSPERCTCPAAVEFWEAYDAKEEQRRQEEAEILRRAAFKAKVEGLFKQSRLGERFKARTFGNFKLNDQNKAAYETALKYATEFDKYKSQGIGLIFNGTYGTGKTHLAAAITNQLLNRGIPVIFGTTITLLGKLKESYSGEVKESESEIIDLYSTIELLVLDDLGKERVNEWVLEKLYLIINARYENNLPLIVTTNYNIDDLPRKLTTDRNCDTAGAVTSRLWEMCRGIEMIFDDWRKKDK
jgi:DNA replication protein DnaC